MWGGNWKVLSSRTDYCELMISGRGSRFQTVIGAYSDGNYLCIPSIDIGCALGLYNDVLWNRERLSQVMDITDAVTITEAIADYSRSKIKRVEF
jgi:hypothetical protein